jgi:hypothetical protein
MKRTRFPGRERDYFFFAAFFAGFFAAFFVAFFATFFFAAIIFHLPSLLD